MTTQDDSAKLSQFLQASIEQAITQQIASLNLSTGKTYRLFRHKNFPGMTTILRDTEQMPGYEVIFGPDTFEMCVQRSNQNVNSMEAHTGISNERSD